MYKMCEYIGHYNAFTVLSAAIILLQFNAGDT